MWSTLSKAAFSTLAGSPLLKRVASRYGMRGPSAFARRFVAGETLAEALAVAAAIERQGQIVTLDHLGEKVATQEAALAAAQAYIEIVKAAAGAGVSRNLSVKLTQLGLDIDRATCIDTLRRVLDVAAQADFFVRIDMEGSAYTALTLDVFESLWRIGCRNIGVVIQAYLHRSPGDITRLNELGARVRLVKGAYREPKTIAYQDKADVDHAFVTLMQQLLTAGHYPAIATHDPAMIAATTAFATERGLARTAYEFQLLYGIRRDLQRSLSADGHPVRIYVPFGTEWFPYFMRRLGERPANVGFVVRHMFRELQD